MQKTKLGLSIGMLSTLIYLVALFGEYTPLLLLVGYVLLFEQNDWLKRVCFKAVAILVAFSIATALVDLVPDVIGIIADLVSIFDERFSYSAVSSIVSALKSALSVVKTILLLMLALKAYKIRDVKLTKIDTLIDNQ